MTCFGLIAEDVAEVNPELVLRSKDGDVSTVRYEQINAMLLNEFLKEHKKVEQQQASISELKGEMQTMVAQLKEQAAQIQKVSAQVQVNKPAPQVVVNKP
jgi:ATP/maltotriose-dependent transcriptional regulator MalT